jgi:hypothetical protein
MEILHRTVTLAILLSAVHSHAAGLAWAVELHDAATLTDGTSEDEFPAIGRDATGQLWTAWVSYDGRRDQVHVAKRDGDSWSTPAVLSEHAGDYWRPTFGLTGDGTLWLTWSENRQGNWDILGCFCRDGDWSDGLRLTTGESSDMNQQLATDTSGRLWMTWQAVIHGSYEVLLAPLTADGLGDVQNVSNHPASDWEPAIASGPNGRIDVAWDSYRNGNYDIMIRSFRDGRPESIRQVTESVDYEAHAALAIDPKGRAWIAWDNGGPHWGQHGDARLRLHSRRSIHLCCLDGQDCWSAQAGLRTVFSGELARFCELPELLFDGDGRLWFFIRHLENLTPSGRRPNGRPYQARGIWNPYATCFDGGQWTTPVKLPRSNGRNDMRVSACVDMDGQVWAAWSDDGRKPSRAEEPVNHNIHSLRLMASASEVTVPPVADVRNTPVMAAEANNTSPADRYAIVNGKQEYQLLYGDTHRHTDLSRCAMNYDGSLIDTYRYAIDAAQLDFLAISDHDQDLLKHRYDRKQSPLLGHLWWRSQKYCDLFHIPDRFLTFYAYEHGGSFAKRGGHKNVIYRERGMPCYEEDSPTELFHVLRDKQVVVIPHQLADGASATDWKQWNSEFERVAEIFQARGSYEYIGAKPAVQVQREGNFLWNALDTDIRIGVIASSDHGLVHGAYAAVYAMEFSRTAVLDALRDRRTFGATDKIVLDLRLKPSVIVGQETETGTPPQFEVYVRGTAVLKQVQIVKNGQFAYTQTPKGEECRFRYTDTTLAPGEGAYYYLRCEQKNQEWAWSSAIWVERPKR